MSAVERGAAVKIRPPVAGAARLRPVGTRLAQGPGGRGQNRPETRGTEGSR